MNDDPDLESVVAPDEASDDPDETRRIHDLLRDAEEFLEEFTWCERIQQRFVGLAVGGVVGVFLFEIEPALADVPRWIWVVVGDLPPLYLSGEDAKTPREALELYIGAMRLWIEQVRTGRAVDGAPPVDADQTAEHADMLESRLDFLERELT